jgi:hypothetical protein
MSISSKLFSVVALAYLGCTGPVHAKEENIASQLMVISKMTGACGVMQQMASFQRTTQMPGGTEFIERFWRTEFARLGKTQAQFIKECEQAIEIYERYTTALEQTKK